MSTNKKPLIWGLSRECLRLQEKGLLIADKGPLWWVNFQIDKQQPFDGNGLQCWLYILIPRELLNTDTGGPSQISQIRIWGRGVQAIPSFKSSWVLPMSIQHWESLLWRCPQTVDQAQIYYDDCFYKVCWNTAVSIVSWDSVSGCIHGAMAESSSCDGKLHDPQWGKY